MMDQQLKTRAALTATGAGLGVGLWLLSELIGREVLTGRVALATGMAAVTLSVALLMLAGPLRLARAAVIGAGLSVLVAGLTVAGSLRYGEAGDLLGQPQTFLAVLAVVFIPLPFAMSWAATGGLRAYPLLFGESWGMVVRGAVAWVFTALVWGIMGLSSLLLSVVGLGFFEQIFDLPPLPWVITGAILGLSLAVIHELAAIISPALVIRLLRLLVLPVLVVLVVFLLALPLRGLSGLVDGISAAGTLLAMTAAAAMLVTVAAERDAGAAVSGRLMVQGARAMAAILPLPPALAAWALALRVGQHGWTPERLFLAALVIVGLGYGVSYGQAALRRGDWMARLRAANVTMAMVVTALAALWIAVFPAEWISARDQLARITDGRRGEDSVRSYEFTGWGLAGADALAQLQTMAKEPGHAALAAALASDSGPTDSANDVADKRARLVAIMPLQPPGATATRDQLLEGVDSYLIDQWLTACQTKMDNGRAGCVFVVADLLPRHVGEEAVVITRDADGYVGYTGLGLQSDGAAGMFDTRAMQGGLPDAAAGAAMITALQDAPPALRPAPLNMIGGTGPDDGLVILP